MPAYWINFSYVGNRSLKHYNVTGPLANFDHISSIALLLGGGGGGLLHKMLGAIRIKLLVTIEPKRSHRLFMGKCFSIDYSLVFDRSFVVCRLIGKE